MTNNRLYFNIDYQEIQDQVKYQQCMYKNYKSLIILSSQLTYLHFIKRKKRRDLGYQINCDNCMKKTIRIRDFKVVHYCSSCELKTKDIGVCKTCGCEDNLVNSKCFICNEIEEVNNMILDYINTDDNSLKCRDCDIEKGSVKDIKLNNCSLYLCKYCYLNRLQ